MMGGVHRASGVPTDAQICIIPAGGAAFQWVNATLVKGVQQTADVAWQGWYSNEYDDAWPAPTFVFEAAVPADAVTAWLLVPTSARGPCTSTIDVVSVGGGVVVVNLSVAGGAAQRVSVPVSA